MDDKRGAITRRLAYALLTSGLLIWCLCVASPAHAQVTPPSEQETQAPPEAPEAPLPPPPKPVSIDLGWSWWNVDGNLAKFRQYATPPNGRFIRELRYISPFWRTGDNLRLQLWSPTEDDYRLESNLSFGFGTTRIEAWTTRNRFITPVPDILPTSERSVTESFFKQSLTPDFAVFVRYRQDGQNHYLESPRTPLLQNTRYWDAVAEGKLGNGQLSIGYTDWRYFDRTNTFPDTSMERWHARYLWEINPSLAVEGTFARMDLRQQNRPSSKMETLNLASDLMLGTATELALSFRQDRIALPVVQNATVQERRSTSALLIHRWSQWSLQVGVREREAERVRADRSFVDVPRWWTVEGRLWGRLSKQLRLTVRGWDERLNDPPAMLTADPRSLYWDNRRFAQVKLDGGTPAFNGYITYTYRRWANGARAVALNLNGITLGGTWTPRDDFSLFAEYSSEAWTARSEVTQSPTLDNFVPNSRVSTVGFNWNINSRATISASYTNFVTDNDNPLLLRDGNTEGRFFTANLSYRLPSDYELTLTIAPWSYRDEVVSLMDYDTHLVLLSLSGRF
ncbi:hypothetical protein HRbin16_02483 [bacterium HR16]|nr:hypothetical protein HRbin16_02483 [bacterium HR16]